MRRSRLAERLNISVNKTFPTLLQALFVLISVIYFFVLKLHYVHVTMPYAPQSVWFPRTASHWILVFRTILKWFKSCKLLMCILYLKQQSFVLYQAPVHTIKNQPTCIVSFLSYTDLYPNLVVRFCHYITCSASGHRDIHTNILKCKRTRRDCFSTQMDCRSRCVSYSDKYFIWLCSLRE